MHKLLLSAKTNYKLNFILHMINTSSLYVLCAAGRKPKTQQSAICDGSPDLGIKKKPREGKGIFSHLSNL